MRSFFRIFIVTLLVLLGGRMLDVAYRAQQTAPEIPALQELRESEDNGTKPTQLNRRDAIQAEACTYSPSGGFSQNARTRTNSGVKRLPVFRKTAFVRGSSFIDTANSIGYILSACSHPSGTLSRRGHFIILRHFRI